MERTLVILKPDAVQRQVVGEIVSRFEKAGLKIIGMKMLKPTREHYHNHYETIGKMVTRRGKEVFDITLDYVSQGPVIAFVLEGVEAVSLVRKMAGTTEPKEAPPGTIRGDYTHLSFKFVNDNGKALPNVIHASGDVKDAKAEIYHWFNDNELFEYSTVHEKYTLGDLEKNKK